MTRRVLPLTLAFLASSMLAFAASPSNDSINRAVVVRSLPFVDVLDTTHATTAISDPECVGQGPTVWFQYRSTTDQWIEANTFGSAYDTTLSVYTRPQGHTMVQLACNDDTEESVQSQVRFHARPGVTYYVMVGSFASGAGGALVFSLDAAPDQTDLALALRITSAVLNSSTGLVTLQGTVNCSRPLSGYVSGQIIQKRDNAEGGAFFGAEVLCNGSSRWTSISARPRPIRGRSPRTAMLTRARLRVGTRVDVGREHRRGI